MSRRKVWVLARVWLLSLVLGAGAASAQQQGDTDALLADASFTFMGFVRDRDMAWFQQNLQHARALMVVPNHLRVGALVGASAGSGVMVARTGDGGSWLGPAFYNMGGLSLGLQAGGQASQLLLMVMTQRGLDALLSTKAQLGANLSVAAGPVGKGAELASADVYAFAHSKGAFVGVSVEGAVVTPDSARNNEWYGRPVTVEALLVSGSVQPAQAPALLRAVEHVTAHRQSHQSGEQSP